MPRFLFCLLFLLAACSPRCGSKEAGPPGFLEAPPGEEVALSELPEALPEDDRPIQAFMREPSVEELKALGVSPPAEYQAVSRALEEALERLPRESLRQSAAALQRLAQDNPWHSLAESAAFAAIAAYNALGNCEETLEAGTAFVQAWPQGAYAAEVWLKMAFCQKQSGQLAEFRETLAFVSQRYPRSPAGLKAKVELNVHASINELK